MIESIAEITVDRDVWMTLSETKKPVVLYGMGNGADKILGVFERLGIEAADFFASDEFVRGQFFRGKKVLNYSQVCEKYGDFIVAVAFGTRLPEVLELIYRLDGERELYIPDVPVVGDEIFDLAYLESHRSEFDTVYGLLADDKSKQTFIDIVMYKLTGRLAYLTGHTVKPDEVFGNILSAKNYRETADLGAYNGDSIRELAAYSPELKRVCAFEPDTRNFRKLNEYAETAPFRVETHNAAAWSRDCGLEFTSGGNRNSSLLSTAGIKSGAKTKTVSAFRLDGIYQGNCDFIKYDVEGAEFEALLGSRGILEHSNPELLVSAYHRTEDLHRLPKLLRSFGYNRIYLRRFEYIPAWDLNLLAVYK